jgi:hypothetical protein
MSLKTRIAKLSRGREQTLIMLNALPPREYPGGMIARPHENTIPYTPRQEGETRQDWDARITALGRELYPRAEIVYYPHVCGDVSSMETWEATRNPAWRPD